MERNILSDPRHPPASSDANSNSSSTSISPPFQSPGLPKACHPVLGAPLRAALCAVVKATSTPVSASRPSRWCPLDVGGVLHDAHPLGVGGHVLISHCPNQTFGVVSIMALRLHGWMLDGDIMHQSYGGKPLV